MSHPLKECKLFRKWYKGISIRKIVCIAGLCWLSSSVTTFSKLARLSQQEENELFSMMEDKFGKDVWEAFSVDKQAANLDIPALLFHDRYLSRIITARK